MSDIDRDFLSNDIIRQALDEAPEVILIRDRNEKIIYINKLGTNLFGYSINQLRGKSFLKLVPERLQAEHIASFQALWQSESHGDFSQLILLPAPRTLPGNFEPVVEIHVSTHRQLFVTANNQSYVVSVFRLMKE